MAVKNGIGQNIVFTAACKGVRYYLLTLFRAPPSPIGSLICLVALTCACSNRPIIGQATAAQPASAQQETPKSPAAAPPPAMQNPHAVAQNPDELLQVLIEEPQRLQALEAAGLSFGQIVVGAKLKNASNQTLATEARYLSLVNSLNADLELEHSHDKKLGPSMAFVHRLFDVRWLKSRFAQFELVGVVNRMDRAVFNPETCGELRLIYRLAYQKPQAGVTIASRLPMTVNVVFLLPSQPTCAEQAKPWLNLTDDALLAAVGRAHLKSVEINLQAVRWPATIRPDMGGHAVYFLRVFKAKTNAGPFELAPLENTPDVEKLLHAKPLRQELLDWLKQKDNLAAVDKGVAVMPEKFLAKRASSYALYGLNRLANRPFDSLFGVADFSDVDVTNLKTISGPNSLRRRLNDITCVGCHQGRTIAGFHFLGSDGATTAPANAIYSSRSPHLADEIARRQAYVAAVAAGGAGDPARPFSERDPARAGQFGEHCGLPGSEYSKWTCGAGLTCVTVIVPTGAAEIGECLTTDRTAGSPCQAGSMGQNSDPNADKLSRTPGLSCRDGFFCEDISVGFPAGMCSGGCADLHANETCGAIAILAGFNACLAKGEVFSACLQAHTRPGALQACDQTHACRSDYICTRTAQGTGACIPPYFLFQLRVDGHPGPG